MAVTKIEEGGLGTDSFNLPITLNGTDGSSTDAGDNIVLDASASGVDAGERLLYEGHPPNIPADISSNISVLSGVTLTIADGATIANSGTATGFSSGDPSSADGDSLGTASLEWSDLYLADGGVIYFGNDQDITITHNPDAGVTLGGTTPTLTMGDGGAEDTKIVFDGNEKDFYVGLDDSENKLIIGRGSAVGTNNILTIIDDEISIGDGSAVDTKIRWDGNAQDYYIGLDDTDDDFKIGKGTTVGTTASIVINEDGIITQPLQPAFLAYSDAVSNVTGAGGSYTPANFANEVFDNNGDYNNSTFTFTAPVTGRYQANVKMNLGGATSSYTRVQMRFQASNRDIIISDLHAYNVSQTDPAYRIAGSTLIDMDASDTLLITIYGYGGSDVLDWLANSYFSAYLVA